MDNLTTDVTVAGPGALGTSLLDALSAAGYRIKSVITRKGKSNVHYVLQPETLVVKPGEVNEENTGRLVFITVPDDVIHKVARELSLSGVDWTRRAVAHTSGSLHSGELGPLGELGASVASFHPLQTFTRHSDRQEFSGINISLEGDTATVDLLQEVVLKLNSKALLLSRQQKSVLHVAAVFLSNYLVSLGGIADELIRSALPGSNAGILGPLLLQTASNLANKAPEKALTGPISRGDSQTVERHLKLLDGDPELTEIYRLLGRRALRLARKKGSLPAAVITKLDKLLQDSRE